MKGTGRDCGIVVGSEAVAVGAVCRCRCRDDGVEKEGRRRARRWVNNTTAHPPRRRDTRLPILDAFKKKAAEAPARKASPGAPGSPGSCLQVFASLQVPSTLPSTSLCVPFRASFMTSPNFNPVEYLIYQNRGCGANVRMRLRQFKFNICVRTLASPTHARECFHEYL